MQLEQKKDWLSQHSELTLIFKHHLNTPHSSTYRWQKLSVFLTFLYLSVFVTLLMEELKLYK